MKKRSLRIAILLTASALTAVLGASCSTVRGVGRDVGKAGEHIENSTR